jgi:hypothetical protein
LDVPRSLFKLSLPVFDRWEERLSFLRIDSMVRQLDSVCVVHE